MLPAIVPTSRLGCNLPDARVLHTYKTASSSRVSTTDKTHIETVLFRESGCCEKPFSASPYSKGQVLTSPQFPRGGASRRGVCLLSANPQTDLHGSGRPCGIGLHPAHHRLSQPTLEDITSQDNHDNGLFQFIVNCQSDIRASCN